MAGALPGRSAMTGHLTLGYRQVIAKREMLLAPAGVTLRGHEFHYSDWIGRPEDMPAAYQVTVPDTPSRQEGYAAGKLLASYIHLHWGAAPEMADRFVAACRTGEFDVV
jgi:cobyrinic acid a,c-diamide synthase